jgi:ATP/maltotriose-dependent transcriptional regulator MalT
MTTGDALDRGRDAYGRQAWLAARENLLAADLDQPLELDDLERLGTATYLVGLDDEALTLLTRGHREALRLELVPRAVRYAFWVALELLQRGESAQGNGWLSRARRLLEDQPASVEPGYLLVAVGLQHLGQGDYASAETTFDQAAAIADRFADPDLAALGRIGIGEALIGQHEFERGVALMDDAMVAVTGGEVSPIVAGIAYCSVIEACHRMFDLRRAQEWTAALGDWVASQPELVPYRGECLLYRAELMAFHGAWADATDEARRAHERLSRPSGEPAAGGAVYQQAELHRLRGEFGDAERAYRAASQQGRPPEPGLALLRLAQGKVGPAASAIRRSLGEQADDASRPRLLEAHVEIAIAAGDLASAKSSADELRAIADRSKAPILGGIAGRAAGAVGVARGEPRAALVDLRRSLSTWQSLEAPYEVARTRVLIARACRELGDEDAASMELEAATDVFRRLGAHPDLDAAEALSRPGHATSGGLTAREVEVLRLVATGMSNRAIATELVISEKTVARHMSNIFTKLGLASRSAATAYAYKHGLVAVST